VDDVRASIVLLKWVSASVKDQRNPTSFNKFKIDYSLCCLGSGLLPPMK
jgi:hypothetical protein